MRNRTTQSRRHGLAFADVAQVTLDHRAISRVKSAHDHFSANDAAEFTDQGQVIQAKLTLLFKGIEAGRAAAFISERFCEHTDFPQSSTNDFIALETK